jgi:hypothetical protein
MSFVDYFLRKKYQEHPRNIGIGAPVIAFHNGNNWEITRCKYMYTSREAQIPENNG